MNAEFKAAWLAALRSGEYKQGRNYLRDGDGFCCLGVACDVALKQGLVPGEWDTNGVFWSLTDSERYVMPESVANAIGLSTCIEESKVSCNPMVSYNDRDLPLSTLNDGDFERQAHGLSFTEIANIIEEQL